MSIEMSKFGNLKDGREVTLYTITNKKGSILKLSNLGACMISLMVPDRNGKLDDVILGYDDVALYEKGNSDSQGATIGRYANRLTHHRFVLNGKEYVVPNNDGEFSLHSGPDFYFERLWDAELVDDEEGQGVIFSLESPDMDQGYPGNLSVSVTMLLTEDDSVVLEYDAVCDQDTIFNMTNHTYFNLNGHDSGSILDHKLWIDAEGFTFKEGDQVTTGEIRSVEGTPMDFRQLKTIGEEIDSDYEPLRYVGGYDHNFALKTNGEDVDLVAKLVSEKSGRVMDVFTDLPGMQIYTGNFLREDRPGKGGVWYKHFDGVAMETHFFPDAINHPNFVQPILRAGVPFNSCTVYHFSVLDV